MSTEPLLVELGTEELPPKSLKTLGLAFRDGLIEGLQERKLGFGEVKWFATPRRLAVLISDVQLKAADTEVEILGPPLANARDEAGNWSAAATGFAKKQGVTPDELAQVDTPKGVRLGITRKEQGIRACDSVNAIIQDSIQKLPIAKRMRWGASRVEFVRPVHWVVAMFGADSDLGQILGLETGNTTYGHRFHSIGEIQLDSAPEYEQVLMNEKVIVDFERRREIILRQVEAEAAALGATAVVDEGLLDEVTGLVEWPVALTGSFEPRFLSVPAEALVSSMQKHQKYFPVVDAQGDLLPNFITVSNIESKDPDQVIAGNERVIRPRLSDAAFFFETDKKVPLVERVAQLDNVVFQQKLGTLKDKTDRVTALAGEIAQLIDSDAKLAQRAALLSKADLLTDMVQEFADMQGIAGYHYALNDGEEAVVATAIAQQYWPKFAGDRLPEESTACALGIADRLDTLVGIFGIGQPPTGSKDPFGLRRASLSVLRIMVNRRLDLDLRHCLHLAVAKYSNGVVADDSVSRVFDYMIERFRAWFEEEDVPVEVFKAVAARNVSHPLDIQNRVHAVHAFSSLPEAAALAAANKRVANILGKLNPDHRFSEVSTDLLVEPAEKELRAKIDTLSETASAHFQKREYTQALACLAALQGPVDAFFDSVMVNAEDPKLRNNRLSLLNTLQDLFLQVADISQLAVAK
ncbi:MAG: glycine--tRNA ligase subunit beta [Pseudomonadota bacterium]